MTEASWQRLVRAAAAELTTQGVDARLEGRVGVYLHELERWNPTARLTGYRTDADRVRHLVLESLLLLRVLPPSPTPLLDIGTGPGVPGLILKLARPDWEIALLEANRRRVSFLRHVTRALALADVAIHHGRAEALAEDPALRGAFRCVTMRAVRRPEIASAWARPFLRQDGNLVLSMGPDIPDSDPAQLRTVELVAGGLCLRRTFLILPASEASACVPRGTSAIRDQGTRGRQPERRRRQDHDGRESGRRPRRRGPGDAARRPRSPDERDDRRR